MEYQPGKFNPTDCLSRHPLQDNTEHHKNAKKRKHVVKAIVKESITEAVILTKVLDATRSDKTLQKLNGYISSRRFKACKKDPDTKCYSSVFYKLSNINGSYCKWLFHIPCKHELSRSSIKVIKGSFLQSRVWFPGIDKLVEREVKSICIRFMFCYIVLFCDLFIQPL